MNKLEVEKYLHELPSDLIKAVKPLSNERELALYVCIMKEGPFRFQELKKKFDIHQETLSNDLTALMAAGLIERISEISDETFAEIHLYNISPLGESMMRSMFKGALFINSYPDCLKRVGKCNHEMVEKSQFDVRTSADEKNFWQNKEFTDINPGFKGRIPRGYSMTQTRIEEMRYEPKKV